MWKTHYATNLGTWHKCIPPAGCCNQPNGPTGIQYFFRSSFPVNSLTQWSWRDWSPWFQVSFHSVCFSTELSAGQAPPTWQFIIFTFGFICCTREWNESKFCWNKCLEIANLICIICIVPDFLSHCFCTNVLKRIKMADHLKCNTMKGRPTTWDTCVTIADMNLSQVRGAAARPICPYHQFQLFTRYSPLACWLREARREIKRWEVVVVVGGG